MASICNPSQLDGGIRLPICILSVAEPAKRAQGRHWPADRGRWALVQCRSATISLRLVHEAAPAPGRSSRGHCGWPSFGRLSVQYRSADTIEDGERHAHWVQYGISYVTKTSFRLADASLFRNKNYDGRDVGVLGGWKVFLSPTDGRRC